MGGLSFDIQGDGTIGKALSAKRLSVPTNQRSYAWDKTHAIELFDDLANALSQDEEYFLGSVVLTRSGASGTPEVVDGQQRLATSVILIAAFRDYLLTVKDEEFAGDLEREFIMSRAYPSREIQPQLRLNIYDHEYFLGRVLHRHGSPERAAAQPTRPSHRRINTNAVTAAARVKQIVAGATAEQRTQRISNWLNYLRERARLIVVTVPDDTQAYIMFETLNDRGLELSKVDLLKNYLFGRSGADRLRETEQRWHAMIGAIESVGAKEATVSTYVRHLWASMHGPTRERELFADIKEKVKSKQAVLQLAGDLADSAATYAALLNPASGFWNSYQSSARRHIATLLLLRMEQVRPLLLALISHAKAAQIPRALGLLVSCSVRFLIVGGLGGGTLEKHYTTVARKVRLGQLKTANDILGAMKEVVPNNTEFEAAFAQATVSQAYLARYYLREMEIAQRGKEPQDVPNDDETKVNLEHVLPESPSAEWKLDPDQMEAYYRRIGNLALVQRTPNEDMGNSGFKSTKRGVLAASEFRLTAEIGAQKQWGPREIEDRQRSLAALAVKTWPLKVQ
jgi:hypothetical protein